MVTGKQYTRNSLCTSFSIPCTPRSFQEVFQFHSSNHCYYSPNKLQETTITFKIPEQKDLLTSGQYSFEFVVRDVDDSWETELLKHCCKNLISKVRTLLGWQVFIKHVNESLVILMMLGSQIASKSALLLLNDLWLWDHLWEERGVPW